MNQSIKKLIVQIAGSGTRLAPITHIVPKEILKLVDRPVVHYLVEEAYQAGIRHIIFIIHPEKRILKDYFSNKGKWDSLKFPNLDFTFLETKDRFGDGQAILCARNLIDKDEVFAVSMGDLLSLPGESLLEELIAAFLQYQVPVIAVKTIPKNEVDQCGIVIGEEIKKKLHRVGTIVERPTIEKTPGNLGMVGKYVLTPEIFTYLHTLMKVRKDGKEVKLAYALHEYAQDKKLIALQCKSKHFDTGTKLNFLKTEIAFALKNKELKKDLRLFLKNTIGT